MKICLVSQEYPPETAHGGIATQTWLKARGLSALGHEVQVISHGSDGEVREEREGRLVVTRIPGPEVRGPVSGDAARWLMWSCEVAEALARCHARRPFDLVDVADYGAEGFVPLVRRGAGGPRFVLQLHGSLAALAEGLGWPDRSSELYRAGTALEDACLRLVDGIYASSSFSATWCERRLGRTEGSIPVLHAGVETDRFVPSPSPLPFGPPTVLFLGKVSRSKGAELLVDAALRARKTVPDLRVQMFGSPEGSLADCLRDRVRDAGAADLLSIGGVLPRDRLPDLMSKSHVLAAPSPFEAGPGFVYLEAMSAGLPVIACSGSGVTELVEDGATGALVPPESPAALSDALVRLLTDEPRRRTMGEEARRRVLAAADTRTCVARIAAYYATILGRG